MKKKYESPKAEKTVFEYSNIVVASNGCTEENVYTLQRYYNDDQCNEKWIGKTWTK